LVVGIARCFAPRTDAGCRVPSRAVVSEKTLQLQASEPLGWLHFSILAARADSLVWGSAAALALLDPYSLFGRFMNSMVDPALREVNNIAAWIAWTFDSRQIVPVKIYWPPWWSFLISLSVLIPVLLMAALRGRVFCNSVCPAGAMLRLISRFSLFTLQIDGSLCNRCGSCERSCKAGCIDRKSKAIDVPVVFCASIAWRCVIARGCHCRMNPLWKSLPGERRKKRRVLEVDAFQRCDSPPQ
jgi:NAD-dependent dihydropyrimidine dehydrogenase PreA subunit